MALADLMTTASALSGAGPKPRDDELDLFGLTDPGKVRKNNQDHFLLGTVHQQFLIHGTSLPNPDSLPLRSERLATIMMVADGVGGSADGADASQLAVETTARYVTTTMQCYHTSGRSVEKEFFEALKKGALEAHDAVRAEAATRASSDPRPVNKSMATTLTLGLAVWPWLYVLQLGDSRCYIWTDGVLHQVTRDQTLAQDLVDKGALPAERAADSPFSNVLASAIGGREATPVVSRHAVKRGIVVVLCSDGLTKHVSDAEIAAQCAAMQGSEQLCRTLVGLALERGGTDNVTVIGARVRP